MLIIIVITSHMPATPYFIAAQLALFAASAVVVKTNFNGKTKPQHSPTQEVETDRADALRSAHLLARAKALPTMASDRFALAEEHPDLAPAADSSKRPMGFSDRAKDIAQPPAGFAGPLGEPYWQEQKREPAAADAPPSFDPVPANAGYHITADAATNFDLKTHTVVFSGDVSLKCADFILTAKRLVVHMKEDAQSMEKLVANGDVDIHLVGVPKEEAYRGQSEHAVFDPATSLITLTGWPKIIGQGREHNAASASTRMMLNTATPKLLTEGRASTRLLFDGKAGMPGLTMGEPSAAPAPGQ